MFHNDGTYTLTRSTEFYLLLTRFIDYLKDTRDTSWSTTVLKTLHGENLCVFGHLWKMGGGEVDTYSAQETFHQFTELVANELMLTPVNDSPCKAYPQTTPKARCIAYLTDMLEGRRLNIQERISHLMIDWNKRKGDMTAAYTHMGAAPDIAMSLVGHLILGGKAQAS